MAYSFDPQVRNIIHRAAVKYNIDPLAAFAVAMGEGGVKWGAVGDNGLSYGPFQLYTHGALPKGKNAAWANSPAGVDYAIRKMAEAGAAGLTGQEAIDAIVRKFERPANPDASVQNAIQRYSDPQFRTMLMKGIKTLVEGAPIPGRPDVTPLMQNDSVRAAALGVLQQIASGQKVDFTSMLGDIATARQAQTTQPMLSSDPTGQTQPPPGPVVELPSGLVSPLTTKFTTLSEYGTPDPEGAPSAKGGRYHAAKDWFAPAGSVVVAPVGGKIVEVKASRGNSGQIYGGVVKVQAPNGMVFVFRHVDPRNVKVGATVDAGTPIASVSAWKSGSPHAHIEVWKTLDGGYRYENMLDPAAVFGG